MYHFLPGDGGRHRKNAVVAAYFGAKTGAGGGRHAPSLRACAQARRGRRCAARRPQTNPGGISAGNQAHPPVLPKEGQPGCACSSARVANTDSRAAGALIHPRHVSECGPAQGQAGRAAQAEVRAPPPFQLFNRLLDSVEQTKQWDSEFWKGRSANPFLQPKKPSTPDNDANRSASPAPKRVFVIQDPTEAPWPDSCNVHVERATAATDNSSLRWPFRELAPQAVHQKAYGMVWIDEPSGTAQEKPTQWPAPRHNSDQLWTEKYRPRLCADVCGNSEQVNKLRDWLKRWQPSADDALERTVDVVRKRRRKLVADPSSDDGKTVFKTNILMQWNRFCDAAAADCGRLG